mmetsp:Transcript_17890/g.49559  ORF Transcript_17890/g.49559 Transcript_17890/m.49559 type:complete len:99 (-) Transcript_17890:1160-1456(-)
MDLDTTSGPIHMYRYASGDCTTVGLSGPPPADAMASPEISAQRSVSNTGDRFRAPIMQGGADHSGTMLRSNSPGDGESSFPPWMEDYFSSGTGPSGAA